MRIVIAAAVMTAALIFAPGAWAQSSRPPTLPPVEHGQTLTTNPLGTTFEWFSVEYERRASDTTSWGVVGTTLDLGLSRYGSVRVLARYHPQEAAPSGFYVGVQGGLHYLDSEMRPGIGVELGENWLFGSDERFIFGTGFGLVRVFGGSRNDVVLPILRLNVGVAF